MTEVCRSVRQLSQLLASARSQGQCIALVPTMGNLHQGHIRLVTVAREQADVVVTSIYVNPTQFGENEDFDNYPRSLDKDLQMLRDAGCDYAFVPDDDEMYPQPPLTQVTVPQIAKGYCSADRPNHFSGVCQAVARLFNMVQPQLALFGEKDFQQLQIVRRLVQDLAFPVRVLGVPTVREADGLAMSSRNNYLNQTERAIAPNLYQVLCDTAAQLQKSGNLDAAENTLAQAREHLKSLGFQVEYLELAEQESLQPAQVKSQKLVLLTAARLGETRLIDNISLEIA